MSIQYVIGDATQPQGDGNKIICHVCNDIGAWGAGFVLAISKRWPLPEDAYRRWSKDSIEGFPPFELGQIQPIQVADDIWVCNMVAQDGIRYADEPPIRYHALQDCLKRVATLAQNLNASIHMPRIGCGLAGGKWELVERIIGQELGEFPVTVYDLK